MPNAKTMLSDIRASVASIKAAPDDVVNAVLANLRRLEADFRTALTEQAGQRTLIRDVVIDTEDRDHIVLALRITQESIRVMRAGIPRAVVTMEDDAR